MFGKKPFRVRWVDVSKQDGDNPAPRSISVAKVIEKDFVLELYAAIAPSECFRMIISNAVTTTDEGSNEQNKLSGCDVSRAYFYAP